MLSKPIFIFCAKFSMAFAFFRQNYNATEVSLLLMLQACVLSFLIWIGGAYMYMYLWFSLHNAIVAIVITANYS